MNSQTRRRQPATAVHSSDPVGGPGSNGSTAVMTRFVLPEDTNELGIMHGGYLAAFIDEIATVVAIRHAGRTAVTKKIEVELIKPARCGNVMTLTARVTSVGRTSIVVTVDGVAENARTRQSWPISKAQIIFVGIDEEGTPVPVPPIQAPPI